MPALLIYCQNYCKYIPQNLQNTHIYIYVCVCVCLCVCVCPYTHPSLSFSRSLSLLSPVYSRVSPLSLSPCLFSQFVYYVSALNCPINQLHHLLWFSVLRVWANPLYLSLSDVWAGLTCHGRWCARLRALNIVVIVAALLKAGSYNTHTILWCKEQIFESPSGL